MELNKYIGKKIRVDLTNGYFYEGIVLNADDNSLTLRDIKNNLVSIKETAINFIREVSK